tara:strand:- start:183 stop:1385 length:1203 start_codon:yes stop_codon:yes gene_type:complete
MREALLLSFCGLSHAYLVGRPLDWVPPARSPARSPQTTLVLSDIKGAAIEATVSHKVQRKLADAQAKYDIPQKYIDVIHGFFTNYMVEIYKSGGDVDFYEEMLSGLLAQVLLLTKEPPTFEPFHRSVREPFDYYAMGVDFARGIVEKDKSLTCGASNIEKIQLQLAAGDNVVLLANHQSEADPQIFSILLDDEYPGLAESTIFVAGDRVTTDMLAKPFSMGRNLLCIFSKKHVDNPPEQRADKMRHNRMVMKRMGQLLKEGGQCIWVAPSGGRDRPDGNGDYQVADFDAKSVEMFRLMADKAQRPTHFYPLSMFTFPNLPPPVAVGGAVGEVRIVKRFPAGLHFADEVNLENFSEGCLAENFPEGCTVDSTREELRDAFARHCQQVVSENYKKMEQELLV